MPVKTRNLFLSHSWRHGDAYDRLIELLKKRRYFSFNDYSIPEDDPVHDAANQAELYEAIKNHIRPCHVVIVMAGVYATYSKWITIEIKIAKTEFGYPKPIVAVKPWGNTNVSTVVSENADRLVGWNTESVVSAIQDLS